MICAHEGVGAEDRPQPLDELEHLGVLLDHLLALELRQALEPHVQDGLRLDLAQLELAHQRLAGGVDARRGPDQADHQVEVVERLPEALQDVRALLGAREVVAGAPDHDLPPEVDEVVEHLPERDDLRPPPDEGQHVHAERRLHRGVLVELVEDDLRDLPLPQLQHHPDAVPVRLVADLGEAVELPLARELGDLGHQRGLVHLIRELGHHDGLAPAAELLGVGPGPHRDDAAPGRERVADARGAVDVPAGRKVRALDHPEQLLDRQRRVLEHEDQAVDDLAEVVRAGCSSPCRPRCRTSH